VTFFREKVLGLSSSSTPAPSTSRSASVARRRTPTAPAFSVEISDVPAEIFGLESYDDPVARAPRIARSIAMQCPAVKRSHDLVAGVLGGLPIQLFDGAGVRRPSPLLDQPEDSVPRSITMTRTVADMFFDECAWWRITRRDYRQYPTAIERLSRSRVNADRKKGRVFVDGRPVDDRDLIRFDSPFPGLLTAGARAIRTALILDAAAARYAEGAPPADYFTPTDGVDPYDADPDSEEDEDAEIRKILDDWKAARNSRSTAYVPASLSYQIAGWAPDKLQLADARNHAVLEISRVAGVDPEELGVSTTSRTYANSFDRRKSYIDFTLGGYRQAIEDRLAMRDVTPTGYYARFDLTAFLRSDDLTRLSYHEKAIALGLETLPEAIAVERGLNNPPEATAAPAPAAQTAPALRVVPTGTED
jgi:hypothetical protein